MQPQLRLIKALKNQNQLISVNFSTEFIWSGLSTHGARLSHSHAIQFCPPNTTEIFSILSGRTYCHRTVRRTETHSNYTFIQHQRGPVLQKWKTKLYFLKLCPQHSPERGEAALHFKICAHTRKQGHPFPWLNQKRNISKEKQKDLANPLPRCEFIPPTQQCRQHAKTSPKTWQRGFLLHPCCICQTDCPSPFEIPSPQMSQGRIGKAPREAHAGFILAPCGPQHFTDASHAALTLIHCHPSATLPVFCPSVLWILCVYHVILVKLEDAIFYISKITDTFPVSLKNWLLYRYFANISYFCLLWTLHPCITKILSPLQLSIARSKAETTASIFLKVFVTVAHRVKQSHHFYCNYSDYFECSCKNLIQIKSKAFSVSLTGTWNFSWLRLSSHFCAEHGWIIGFLGLRHHGNRLVCAAESDLITTLSCYVALGKLESLWLSLLIVINGQTALNLSLRIFFSELTLSIAHWEPTKQVQFL